MATARCNSSFLTPIRTSVLANKKSSSKTKDMYFEQSLFVDSIAAEERLERAPRMVKRSPDRWPKRSRRAHANSGCPSRARFLVPSWWVQRLKAKMASILAQLRPGKENTWRPKKDGIRWGLGFEAKSASCLAQHRHVKKATGSTWGVVGATCTLKKT